MITVLRMHKSTRDAVGERFNVLLLRFSNVAVLRAKR